MGNQSIKLANKLKAYLPEQNKDNYSWNIYFYLELSCSVINIYKKEIVQKKILEEIYSME